jgi:hypothetical protein
MFGDVGLGVESRQALLVPDTAMLHVGRLRYLLVADGQDTWQLRPIIIGELHSGRFEIISGIEPHARIVSRGGGLLKSLAIQALASGSEGDP